MRNKLNELCLAIEDYLSKQSVACSGWRYVRTEGRGACVWYEGGRNTATCQNSTADLHNHWSEIKVVAVQQRWCIAVGMVAVIFYLNKCAHASTTTQTCEDINHKLNSVVALCQTSSFQFSVCSSAADSLPAHRHKCTDPVLDVGQKNMSYQVVPSRRDSACSWPGCLLYALLNKPSSLLCANVNRCASNLSLLWGLTYKKSLIMVNNLWEQKHLQWLDCEKQEKPIIGLILDIRGSQSRALHKDRHITDSQLKCAALF